MSQSPAVNQHATPDVGETPIGSGKAAPDDVARDAQLAAALARCATGERSALRAIYDLEAARMIGVARRILTRRDLAEDAVHDAFVRVWRHAGAFDPARGSARNWLYAILRNRALSIHRRETRYDLADDVEAAIDTAHAVTRLPETSALKRCLEAIEAPRRDLVVLAYAHGMSHGEMAARTKLPLGTVKSWVRRSLISLQECMG